MEIQTFPTYTITLVPINEIKVRSGKVLNKIGPVVIIQEEQPESQPLEDKYIPSEEENYPPDEEENHPLEPIESTTQPKPS